MARPSPLAQAAPVFLLGLAILAGGHLLAYLGLTGSAREALTSLESRHEVASLERSAHPGAAPAPGTAAYSPWLQRYERWHASTEYAVHARHESLVRMGMILSFLIGLGLLCAGLWRTARHPGRRASDRLQAKPSRRASHGPARETPGTIRPLRPEPARTRRSA